MESTNELLRWIPLLPLVAAVASGLWLLFLRSPMPRGGVILIGCGAPIASFLLSIQQVFELTGAVPEKRFIVDRLYTWIGADPFHAELSFLLDPLSAVMILVVTGVGSLIHLYSVGYMDDDQREDRGFQRFFCYLNLFTFSMLMLVLGDNLVVLFVGWEGVGLCSYLLIGFWFLDDHNAACGQKAFVVNRIGDFGFLLGIFLVFWAFWDAGHPTIQFWSMSQNIAALEGHTLALPAWLWFLPAFPSWSLLTVAGLCFFLGACGKSAQLPLHVWLPDAMAGPTPVSALIHAATMVTAGVYMVARLSFLYSLTPVALSTIAWVGGLTALFAGTIALCQNDIKKVLAYSTVSQLGFMFLAAGAMAYSAAIFHVVTHAFFKALLFLGAGSVILGMHHEQDISKMGGLRQRMPWTWATFLVGVLAISGVAPLSGFFSKDQILLGAHLAHHVPGQGWLWLISVVAAAITALYMFRLYFRVFTGESRAPAETRRGIREQGNWVVVPLVVLALLSVIGGVFGLPDIYGEVFFGIPDSNSLLHFLEPVSKSVAHDVTHVREVLLALLALSVAGLGILVAAILYYFRVDLVAPLTARLAPFYRLVLNKFWVDEFYDRAVVQPTLRVADRVLFRSIDARLIDEVAVNGVGRVVRAVADRGLKYAQSGFTQAYVFVMLIGSVVLLGYLVSGS